MKDDTVSRAAVMQSLTREYNRRRTGDGLKLAWIEKAVLGVPAVQTCEDAVSRQAAIDALSTPHGILYPIRTVEELPSVQPQEIIRCKDCKWHGGKYHCRDTDTWGFDDDDFCSYAERRTDE